MNYKSVCNYFLFLIYSSYQLIRLSKAARCPDGVILASLAKSFPIPRFALFGAFAVVGNADGSAKYFFLFLLLRCFMTTVCGVKALTSPGAWFHPGTGGDGGSGAASYPPASGQLGFL
jgi:hypothetical protein